MNKGSAVSIRVPERMHLDGIVPDHKQCDLRHCPLKRIRSRPAQPGDQRPDFPGSDEGKLGSGSLLAIDQANPQ